MRLHLVPGQRAEGAEADDPLPIDEVVGRGADRAVHRDDGTIDVDEYAPRQAPIRGVLPHDLRFFATSMASMARSLSVRDPLVPADVSNHAQLAMNNLDAFADEV